MDQKVGILLKVAATLAFTVMSACVKAMEGSVPVGQVIFCRALFAFLPLCIWFRLSPCSLRLPAGRNTPYLLMGSCAGLGGMFFAFLALAYLPLVNVTVLSYSAPLFTIVLAVLLCRKKSVSTDGLPSWSVLQVFSLQYGPNYGIYRLG